VPVGFGGVTITPGEWMAADADGIIVSSRRLA
jgi:regulator of RNase E activity RraA